MNTITMCTNRKIDFNGDYSNILKKVLNLLLALLICFYCIQSSYAACAKAKEVKDAQEAVTTDWLLVVGCGLASAGFVLYPPAAIAAIILGAGSGAAIDIAALRVLQADQAKLAALKSLPPCCPNQQ